MFASAFRSARGPSFAPTRPPFLRTPSSQAKPISTTPGSAFGAYGFTHWCHRRAVGPSIGVSSRPAQTLMSISAMRHLAMHDTLIHRINADRANDLDQTLDIPHDETRALA